MQYDELTHILHEVNRQEEDEINVAGTDEEEIHEETEANTEEMTTLHQPVTRKSSRESEILAKFKDFIYAIPGKGSTAGNASAHTETMKNLETSDNNNENIGKCWYVVI
ncbi:hypothetical protein BVRB_8g190400 [Beta vulgaris subsp. vulgaris]|uniref:Uncharacterized protein n=1 Tax=Beta vulgaris subsp. vulgaris TaxID=3555 RepID=A0A0J8BR11_BETVV|nr:hypothetical protein BVRB_8g190400 [Beta vulgaris subsp. vulgaris]